MSRIAIETRAKQPSFDIVHMTNAHKMPQNLLAQFDPPEAKHIIPQARDPEPALVRRLHRLHDAGLQHQAGARPTSCRRASRSSRKRKEWAGKVAIDHTDIEWLRGMTQFYGEQKGTALVREIAANLKPVLTDGRLAMARSVAAGEYLFALNNFVNLTLNVKLAGGADRVLSARSGAALFRAGRGQRAARRTRTPRGSPPISCSAGTARCSTPNSAGCRRAPTSRPIRPASSSRSTTRKVVRTQFSQEEEKRLRQMFETLLRKR